MRPLPQWAAGLRGASIGSSHRARASPRMNNSSRHSRTWPRHGLADQRDRPSQASQVQRARPGARAPGPGASSRNCGRCFARASTSTRQRADANFTAALLGTSSLSRTHTHTRIPACRPRSSRSSGTELPRGTECPERLRNGDGTVSVLEILENRQHRSGSDRGSVQRVNVLEPAVPSEANVEPS